MKFPEHVDLGNKQRSLVKILVPSTILSFPYCLPIPGLPNLVDRSSV